MAHDYYNSPYYGNPPRYDQVSPAPDAFRRQNAATPISSISPSPYAVSEPDVQHPHHSHQSLSSDPGYPMGTARGNDNEYYAENIPLKSHATPMPSEWMQQPTHYPPSPEVGEPVGGRRGREKKKKRFFTKKLAWVTYLLTTIQIVVFIVELVKNGIPPSLSTRSLEYPVLVTLVNVYPEQKEAN